MYIRVLRKKSLNNIICGQCKPGINILGCCFTDFVRLKGFSVNDILPVTSSSTTFTSSSLLLIHSTTFPSATVIERVLLFHSLTVPDLKFGILITTDHERCTAPTCNVDGTWIPIRVILNLSNGNRNFQQFHQNIDFLNGRFEWFQVVLNGSTESVRRKSD